MSNQKNNTNKSLRETMKLKKSNLTHFQRRALWFEKNKKGGFELITGAGFRGGDWNNTSVILRASDRNNASNINTERNNNNGFRAVRSVP
jgi:formylglycine-generating enzyme required for sulfatase activity